MAESMAAKRALLESLARGEPVGDREALATEIFYDLNRGEPGILEMALEIACTACGVSPDDRVDLDRDDRQFLETTVVDDENSPNCRRFRGCPRQLGMPDIRAIFTADGVYHPSIATGLTNPSDVVIMAYCRW